MDSNEKADYLVYYMKARSLSAAREAAERSSHPIDAYHERFKTQTWESQSSLELLVDFENLSVRSAKRGLARGIDGEAHRGALAAGGTTVAVLGCGIDRDYPAAHAELARRIRESGIVVSEYAEGTEPAPWRFPAGKRRTTSPLLPASGA